MAESISLALNLSPSVSGNLSFDVYESGGWSVIDTIAGGFSHLGGGKYFWTGQVPSGQQGGMVLLDSGNPIYGIALNFEAAATNPAFQVLALNLGALAIGRALRLESLSAGLAPASATPYASGTTSGFEEIGGGVFFWRGLVFQDVDRVYRVKDNGNGTVYLAALVGPSTAGSETGGVPPSPTGPDAETLLKALVALWLATADLTDAFVGGLHYERAPAGTLMPFAVVLQVAGTPMFTTKGNSHQVDQVTFTLVHSSAADLEDLGVIFTGVFDGARPLVNGIPATLIRQDESLGYGLEPEIGEEDAYSKSFTYACFFNRGA